MHILAKVPGKRNRVRVSCSSSNCPKYKCWHPGQYLHQQKSIDGCQSSYRDKEYSCINRAYHGCPDHPELKDK